MTDIKNKRRRKQAERAIYIIMSIILAAGVIIGSVIGAAIKAQSASNPTELYGSRDGKKLADEGLLVVTSEEFTPLECALSYDLQEYTYYLCQAYYIDFNFAMALMFTESAFKADVISDTNDYGLMQINICNHAALSDKLGITDFTEPYQNIRAGLYILRGLFEKYDDVSKVCMAYNMGEYGASVLWSNGIYTTAYSNKVLVKANEYKTQPQNSIKK